MLFSDREEREIEYITPIRMHTSYTNYLCKKTYGVGIMKLKERWKANIEFDGYNIKAINEDRVMLIYLKELTKEPQKNERKRTPKKANR